MRFIEAFGGWQQGRFSQEEAARLLGVCERTFRRYLERYEEEGAEGLIDKRIGRISPRRASVDEVSALVDLYRREYPGWNVRHFHSWWRHAQLHLGQAHAAGCRGRGQGPGQGQASQEARAHGLAGDAAAPGCEPASMGCRRILGPGGDDG